MILISKYEPHHAKQLNPRYGRALLQISSIVSGFTISDNEGPVMCFGFKEMSWGLEAWMASNLRARGSITLARLLKDYFRAVVFRHGKVYTHMPLDAEEVPMRFVLWLGFEYIGDCMNARRYICVPKNLS